MPTNDEYGAEFWAYEAWPSAEPTEWPEGGRTHPDDLTDFHVDLGCGKVKKGRIGIDRYPGEGVNVVMDLDTLYVYGLPHHNQDGNAAVAPPRHLAESMHGDRLPPFVCFGSNESPDAIGYGLPFPDSSIESMVSHHCLEHIGGGFIPLMDEVYRVLKPGAMFRAIVPLFPSTTAVEDPDHRRYFMDRTFDSFCGEPGDAPNQCWLGSFSVPYTRARFKLTDKQMSPDTAYPRRWTDEDRRELRVSLRAVK